ncbi:MAG: hypothetical protein IT158_22215 [Bryobacterales bacterium]|nr:hypothetical protein [Bryobacterales bacterium]
MPTGSHRHRLRLACLAALLLCAAWLRDRPGAARVKAAQAADPDVIWSLGVLDNASDEFALGSAGTLAYDVASSSPAKDWRARQTAADQNPPVYRVRFRMNAAPAVLHLDCLYPGIAPQALELSVNGRRGFFRVRPQAARDLDERQANSITSTRQAFRIPLASALLRAGDNEIGLAFPGDGGALEYDALSLRRAAAEPPELAASVEPTIFYRRRGTQLTELTEVTLTHRGPLGKAALVLKAGPHLLRGDLPEDGYDFGERSAELEVPALAAPAPYSLEVTAGESHRFQGEFRPEKRWRIFAGLKIHNDIGYTDLQQHVQELDNRNTDGVLQLLARFPFYKFNLETGWLVENYVNSREPSRVKQLMAYAAAGRIGINALYLNLMTGLCTGEEMYRSLYYSKSLQRKHAVPLRFACLTDAPSHTAFVPALLSDAGVAGFAIGSNQTRAPLLQNSSLNEESPFWWEGVNGRRVLAWYARSYLQLHRLVGENPSVEVLRRSVPQFLARYRREGYPVDAVLLYGLYTDNADLRGGEAEVLKDWNQAFAFPSITPATDADYYAYLSERFKDKLPVYKGDGGAYWEDGAASTAAETILNRASQVMLPQAESAAAFATLFHPAEIYPAAEFQSAWKNLLFYDEHTWGAHSSVSQPGRGFVTEQWDYKRAYAWRAHWAAKDLLLRSLNRLVQNISIDGPTFFVFNPDVWPRTGPVDVELGLNQELIDPRTGAPVSFAVLSEKDNYRVARFLADQVPGLGYRAYAVRTSAAVPAPAVPAGPPAWEAESRYYRLVLDPATGAISRLIDKELGRDLADREAPYRINELLYVSGGERSRILQDLATLKPAQLDVTGQFNPEIAVNQPAPFGRRVVVRAQARNVPEIETEILLYDSIKRVDIVNRIRKDETRAKEAVYFAFPFKVSPPELLYQVQNTWVRPNRDQLPGAGREWFTTQNVAVARDAGAAIAWATPDAPLITLTDINRGLWLKHLEVNNGHIFSYAMNNYWFTNYKAEQGGRFTFRYSITSGRALDGAALARFDAETRSPLAGYDYFNTGNVRLKPVRTRLPAAAGSFLEIDAPNARLTAFKQAEDGRGWILRLRETSGRGGIARLRSPLFPLAAAWLASGVEDDKSPLAPKQGTLEIPLTPDEFTTVRLLFGTVPRGTTAN